MRKTLEPHTDRKRLRQCYAASEEVGHLPAARVAVESHHMCLDLLVTPVTAARGQCCSVEGVGSGCLGVSGSFKAAACFCDRLYFFPGRQLDLGYERHGWSLVAEGEGQAFSDDPLVLACTFLFLCVHSNFVNLSA